MEILLSLKIEFGDYMIGAHTHKISCYSEDNRMMKNEK